MLLATALVPAFEASWKEYSSKRCVPARTRQVDSSDSLLQPYNVSADDCQAHAKQCRPRGHSWQVVASLHAAQARAPTGCERPPPRLTSRPSCSSPASVQAASSLKLLVGVMSSPRARERRDAIRATWMQWAGEGSDALICFAMGRLGPAPVLLQKLDEEAREHHDIVWLEDTPDGCSGQHMHIAKAYEWWRSAAAMLGPDSRAHVVKTDDDAQLHLPWLAAQLQPLRCIDHLYFGPMVWVGFNPKIFKQCGWDWSSAKNYINYGCARAGFHPAFPYALGALEVLSAPLAKRLAASASVANFVQVAKARPVIIEDPVLGYWLASDAVTGGNAVQITYVRAYVGNLNCYRQNAGGGRVLNQSAGMHHLKTQAAQLYAWDLLRHGLPYTQPECSARTDPGDKGWKGNAYWNRAVHSVKKSGQTRYS